MKTKFHQNQMGLPLLFAVLVMTTGCGSQIFGGKMPGYNTFNPASTSGNDTSTGSMTSSSSQINIISNPISPPMNGAAYPPYNFTISGVGYNSVSVNVSANSVLKAEFSPGLPNTTIAGTGYTVNYAHLGVYITVGNSAQPTPLLSNGLQGDPAQTSQVMDFSNALTKTCAPNTPTCRQTVTITVGNPNYDYWCITTGFYCPYTEVYNGHPWNGVLKVQTDDTSSL